MLSNLISWFLRFVRSLQGILTLIICGFLIVVGLSMGKAVAQDPIAPRTLLQMQALVQEKASRTPQERKIESRLLYSMKRAENHPLFKSVPSLQTAVTLNAGEEVRVDITLSTDITEELLDQITATGAEILSTVPRYKAIQVSTELSNIRSIASISEVVSIRLYTEPQLNVGLVTSEGDVAHGANLARATYGVDGSGIRIGVLSDSYNNLRGAAADIASNDLPRSGVTLVGTGDLASGGTDEGRAMLQIVHDLAPGASLYFATSHNSEPDFANNILALRNAGCDIIIDDARFFDEPAFQDGIVAQAVNSVTASGALYFSSAGNSGHVTAGTSGTWEGDFVSAGSVSGIGRLHSFSPRLSVPYFNPITESPTGPITLQWSDPYNQPTNDYDLYVFNSAGNMIAASTNTQNGGPGQSAFEIVGPQAAGNSLLVALYSGSGRFLHVNAARGQLQISTNGETLGHAAAANAFSVAATSAQRRTSLFTTASTVEGFSSDGPRRIFFLPNGTPITPGNFSSSGGIVRQKPDITAADGVVTTLSGFNPFRGTSAAAPHAGAVAALLKSVNPNLTPSQIRTILTSRALDIDAPGVDQDSGFGIVLANF